uniref:Uncharacterized protein n=1 Tax=Chromera velia CCMP2878 TaxID=1169474 RepID=A0A0G4FCW7_9ALVE|mmetsp:Transcript_52978/g.103631  ORF Transcript_52978/g.103631 Transcript_52978/m.103631 type:complete len:151 (-) Transcript_52978:683-1135(-)|eukprot:Cvel_16246.t1-p1 / transcript=Cvel_16246.t1 / gene=Cvel_16246 / organism=Chromera_velia_CCMP2878 / gene_product=hypothetical protein / transcript_product=hypothetical protein / location=Cvel_scaffold1243:2533-3098(-) / protein_length=150 / sequence_SO=supercontig / SO=protein_coding / is_pseudo=false
MGGGGGRSGSASVSSSDALAARGRGAVPTSYPTYTVTGRDGTIQAYQANVTEDAVTYGAAFTDNTDCIDAADWRDPDGDGCEQYADNIHWCNNLVKGTSEMTPLDACGCACKDYVPVEVPAGEEPLETSVDENEDAGADEEAEAVDHDEN